MNLRFYHLTKDSIAKSLPPLLDKILQSDQPVMLYSANEALLKELDASLWTSRKVLPHTSEINENTAKHPIFLTHDADTNANKATILVALGDLPATATDFKDVAYMFNGNDADETTAARAAWKEHKDSDATLTYWQQNTKGWQQAA